MQITVVIIAGLLIACCYLLAQKARARVSNPREKQRVEAGGAQADPTISQPAARVQPVIWILYQNGRRSCVVDSDPFTIGRRSNNCLVLDHEDVSRLHAELRKREGEWYLADAGSTNGVFLNGRRVSETALTNEDRIQIGQFRLQFVQPGVPPVAVPHAIEICDLIVGEEISRGSMARVYMAHFKDGGACAAVKVPRFEQCKDARQRGEWRKRFLNEVAVLERLRSHPNIVTVRGHGALANGTPYMVMEFVNGGSLRQAMESGRPVEEGRVRLIGAAVAAGLAAAHRHSIIHRDVKPENVLLDDETVCKLTDFGLARAHGLPSLTIPGTQLGTCHYMSPEQAGAKRTTDASDVYSLGCMLFEMSVGRCPFEGRSLDIMHAHLNDAPDRVSSVKQEISFELDELIDRMLEKDASLRPSADEVHRVLANA